MNGSIYYCQAALLAIVVVMLSCPILEGLIFDCSRSSRC